MENKSLSAYQPQKFAHPTNLMKKTPTSSIESLESRIAPAGLITVAYNAATGALTLDGADNLDHSARIFQPAPGVLRIEGESGTEIESAGNVSFDVKRVLSLTINGGAGIDSFSLTNVSLVKTFTFNGGAGLDDIIAGNLLVKGAVTLDLGANGGAATLDGLSTSVGGDLTVTYGDGGGTVTLAALTSTIKGALTATGGLGSDLLMLGGGKLSVNKGIGMVGNGGTDQLLLTAAGGSTVGKGASGKALAFDGGGGNDKLLVAGSSAIFKGSLSFIGGDSTDELVLSPATLNIAGDLSMIGDIGSDTSTFNIVSGVVKGAVTIDLGEGSNSFTSNAVLLSLGKTLTVKGGSSTDNLTITGTNLTVKGAVLIDHGAGTNSATISPGLMTLGDSLTYTSLGGTDTVNFTSSSSSVKKAVSINTGDGTSTVNMGGAQLKLGALDVKGGTGLDSTFLTATSIVVGGNMSFDGGNAADTFDLQSMLLTVKGKVSIMGGLGADTAVLLGDGSIKGDVTIDLGTSTDGFQEITLQGASGLANALKLGGALTITSASTDPDPVNNGFLDSLIATNLKVAKTTVIKMGDLDSTIFLDNFSLGGTLAIDTGGGDDVLDFEDSNLYGSSLIGKLATIILGDGDDQVYIGISSASGSHDFVRFKGGLSVDGGVGDDISNDILDPTVNSFGVAGTQVNFENP